MDDKKSMRSSAAALAMALLLTAFWLGGCAASRGAEKSAGIDAVSEEESTGGKHITAIRAVPLPDSVDVLIEGDQTLTYTSIKQAVPLRMVFYFPDALFAPDIVPMVPDNGIIESVRVIPADEDSDTPRMELFLKRDVPCDVTRQGQGLKLSFPVEMAVATAEPVDTPTAEPVIQEQNLADQAQDQDRAADTVADQPEDNTAVVEEASDESSAADIPTDEVSEQAATPEAPQEAAPATRLESVSAQPGDEGVQVLLAANGVISEYSTFTLKSPPRIVYDIPNLESPSHREQRVTVDTPWVKRIRYYADPFKLRVVLDTDDAYLAAYDAKPMDNGLAITVGQATETVVEAPVEPRPETVPPESVTTAESVTKSEPTVVAQASQPKEPSAPPTTKASQAWLNRLDFASEAGGKSTVVIGTTAPVKYRVIKESDRKLVISLPDTSIPDYRKRPLITTRFESAVDRIIPIQPPEMRDQALISIELREGVKYRTETDGNQILLHFEATSVPPKPFAEAQLPPWEEVASATATAIQKKEMAEKAIQETSIAGTGAADKTSLNPGQLTPKYTLMGKATQKKYIGEKIALDFYETDIKNVFRILQDVSGKNFAIDQDVTGKVTLSLHKPVPWDQVLDLVLKMNQLDMITEGDIIRIGTQAKFEAAEKAKRKRWEEELKRQKLETQLAQVVTEYIPINYADAESIYVMISKQSTGGSTAPGRIGGAEIGKDTDTSSLLTPGVGNIMFDDRTNQIIVTDLPSKIERIKRIIAQLDRPTRQVSIEARIVEATSSFAREIGVQWGVEGGISSTGTEPYTASRMPGSGTANSPFQPSWLREMGAQGQPGVGPQRGFDNLGGTYGWDTAVNLPIQAAAGALGFNFLRIAGTGLVINAKLMASEENGESKIISAPKIATLDNITATIKSGLRYPYNKLDESGNTVTEFEDIDLILKVTPHVTLDQRISMKIVITKNDLGDVINGQQSFTTKEAETVLLVNDGDTVVIGGIIKSGERASQNGLPFLSKIPILGWLFKTESKEKRKEELLIFITPRIVNLEKRSTQKATVSS